MLPGRSSEAADAMGDIERRLQRLEGAGGGTPEIPVEVRIYLRAIERHRARENGEEPPAYAPDELAALHAEDLDNASGGGAVGPLRESGGWESPEGRAHLDCWEDDARRRLARIEEGETLEAVYGDDAEA